MITQEKKEKINQINKQRAIIYELFAIAFLKEPEATYLEKMDNLLPKLLNLFLMEGAIFIPTDLAEIKQEYYDRIFVPTANRYVPPFESAIINRKTEGEGSKLRYGSLNTAITKHVEACYQQVNFKPLELDYFNPIKGISFADFIGFELAFMAYLCYAQEKSDESGKSIWQNLQKNFLEQHLAIWCQDYTDLMQRGADDFFPSLMRVISLWVKWDLKELQGTGNEKDGYY